MKVLWFSPTPSLYGQNTVRHNGGGWVASLQRILAGAPDINLGIAFEHGDRKFRIDQNGVSYFPISANTLTVGKICQKLGFVDECANLLDQAQNIIADFDPDVIHVFGSENCFGSLSNLTDVPVLIHIQGSLPSYANARFPPGYSRFDFLRASRGNPLRLYRLLSNDRVFTRRALREENILRNCRHFMGRTEWDIAISSIYAPEATYDYCSEALRQKFYDETTTWTAQPNVATLTLVSTISNPLYKGADLILKTARLLREELGRDVRWKVFGVTEIMLQEAKSAIRARDVGVTLEGVADGSTIRDALLDADVYVHPSYIDNSPNSLCEAQILGLPVVATHVGGIASLVDHGVNGYLVPANDPYMLARQITQMKDSPKLAIEFGQNARAVARDRHSPDSIRADLLAIYTKYRRRNG
jgi:glycosyltransferase involved in cell wall biosynthesis